MGDKKMTAAQWKKAKKVRKAKKAMRRLQLKGGKGS